MTLTYAEYRALDAVNISSLLHIARSPAHYRHAIEHGVADTGAMAFGRIGHMAILEPERYADEIAVWDGGRRAGKVWDAWQLEHAGKVQVTMDDHLACMAMSVAVREHPAAGAYLCGAAGLVEHTIEWRHRSGIRCKSRLDWVDLEHDVVVDLKTARDACELEFGRAAARLRYHTRAAFYSDAYRTCYGKDPTFVLVVVEKEPPFAVACYRVPSDLIEAGRREYDELLGRLKYCRDHGEWPGIARDREVELVLPAWAVAHDDGLELVWPEGEAAGAAGG